MANSLGGRIAELRKAKGVTQDELAETLNVSPQAVSKWENDLSCPDIMMLPQLSDYFHVSIDELLRGRSMDTVLLLPPEERKDSNNMLLRVVVDTVKGDRVRVNLPVSLVRMGLEIGMQIPQVSGNQSLQNLDFGAILQAIDSGLIGRLVEVDSAEGDHVEITVE